MAEEKSVDESLLAVYKEEIEKDFHPRDQDLLVLEKVNKGPNAIEFRLALSPVLSSYELAHALVALMSKAREQDIKEWMYLWNDYNGKIDPICLKLRTYTKFDHMMTQVHKLYEREDLVRGADQQHLCVSFNNFPE
jgi:hypothetical protein